MRCLLALLLIGCGAPPAERDAAVDAGSLEAGPIEAGPIDAGPPAAAWAVGLDGRVEAVAADARGNVYALVGDALRAFDRTGQPRWSVSGFPTEFEARHRLAGTSDGVIAATTTEVAAYSADGKERWRRSGASLGRVEAVASRDGVAAVLTSAALVTLDVADGSERWRAQTTLRSSDRRELFVAATPDGWVVGPPLAAYDSEGVHRWTSSFYAVEVHDVAVADDGSILVTGVYDASDDVDIGLGPLPAPTQFDPYAVIFDGDGSARASLAFAGEAFEYAYGAGSDGSRFLVTGHYGESSAPITIGDTVLTPAGDRETFLAWLETDGGVIGADAIAARGLVVGRAVTWSPAGRWVVGGLVWNADVELEGTPVGTAGRGGFLWVGPEPPGTP